MWGREASLEFCLVKRLWHTMSFITYDPNMEPLLTQECAVKRGISSLSLEVVTLNKQTNPQTP